MKIQEYDKLKYVEGTRFPMGKDAASKNSLSLQLQLYAAFVEGMMTFQQKFLPTMPQDNQAFVNFMHAEGKKYVEDRMRKSNDVK